MPRTKGSKNKPPALKAMTEQFENTEDQFLAELLAGKIKWNRLAAEKEKRNEAADQEREYANVYRVLLNRYSADEIAEVKPEA